MDRDSADVAVVGAGPVGALAALRLAQAGLRVSLLDAAPAPREGLPQGPYDLRVVALSPASRQQFEAVGAWPSALQARAQAYRGMQVWDGSGQGRIEFTAAELGVPELGHIIEVPALQWALDQAIAAQDGRVMRLQGAEFSTLEPTAGGARLHCRDGRQIEARLVIGADGRDSKLRARAGIALERRDYLQQGLVAVIEPEQAHGGIARQVFTPEGPLGLLPLANGQLSIVWSLGLAQAQRLLDCDEDRFCRELALACGQPGFHLLSRRVGFPLILHQADPYAIDNIALVGDAAHAVHPLAGLGMNLGFEDVAALAEALDDAPISTATPARLQRYARQRRRAVLPALAFLDALEALFGTRRGEIVQLRDWGLNLVDRQTRIKAAFMRYALGSGAIPHGQVEAKPV